MSTPCPIITKYYLSDEFHEFRCSQSVLQESLIFIGKIYLKLGNKVHHCEKLVALIKMDI